MVADQRPAQQLGRADGAGQGVGQLGPLGVAEERVGAEGPAAVPEQARDGLPCDARQDGAAVADGLVEEPLDDMAVLAAQGDVAGGAGVRRQGLVGLGKKPGRPSGAAGVGVSFCGFFSGKSLSASSGEKPKTMVALATAASRGIDPA